MIEKQVKQPEETSSPVNAPIAFRQRKLTKVVLILLLVIGYTAVVSVVSVWTASSLEQRRYAKQSKDIKPQEIVKESLVAGLDAKAVKKRITYRDNLDRGMLVTWDFASDVSNPRSTKVQGTLAIDFLRGVNRNQQKLEYIIVNTPSNKYQYELYFRMISGNELTGASKDWFKLTNSNIISNERKDLYQRDKKINLFGKNTKAVGFSNFSGFNFFLLTSPSLYLITADMRESPEKNKIISEINNNKAYVLSDCQHSLEESWCQGYFNPGGVSSIDINYATSEGMGESKGLEVDGDRFVMVSDNQTKKLKKFEINTASPGNDDKFVILYTFIDQLPVITPPESAIY